MNEARTFEALVKYGWAVYRTVDDGHRYNGYELTDAGKEIARQGA